MIITVFLHEEPCAPEELYLRPPLPPPGRLLLPPRSASPHSDFQVGELSSPIDFKSHIGFDDYQAELFKKYPKNAWLTPSEIFKPYYGMSIGNYIWQAEERMRHKLKDKRRIRIVEAGAGTGSAAESILFYFQNFAQEAFQELEYHIVEISPALCKHMERKLKRSYPGMLERGQIRIINQNILNYKYDSRCYAIFLEVLDNLPHDKVLMNEATGNYDQMAMVDMESMEESYVDVREDKLALECLDLYLKTQKLNKSGGAREWHNVLDRIATKIVERFYLGKITKK